MMIQQQQRNSSPPIALPQPHAAQATVSLGGEGYISKVQGSHRRFSLFSLFPSPLEEEEAERGKVEVEEDQSGGGRGSPGEEGKSIGQGGASCGIQSFIGSPRLIQLIGWKAGRELLYCNSLSEFSLLAAFCSAVSTQ